MYRVTVHDSIRAIDPGQWDSAGTDPLSSHAVLGALEKARLPGISLRYVTLDSRFRLEAAFPVSTIDIDGERLTHGWFRQGIRAARTLAPGFMFSRLTLCGSPLSVANPPLRLAPGVDPTSVYPVAAGILEELADDSRASWRAFKEFGADEACRFEQCAIPGWIMVPSEPAMELENRWHSFDQYLATLRHPYRRKILRSETRLRRAGISVVREPLAAGYDEDLHRLYEAVLDRASVRLERLVPAFFQELAVAAGSRAELTRFVLGSRTVGWVCTLRSGSDLYDLFHGLDYELNEEADLYFNQLAAVVRYGLELGSTLTHLGQSTEIAKSRFGATPSPRFAALRHRSGILGQVLRVGRPALFPEKCPPAFRVFHATEAMEREVAP